MSTKIEDLIEDRIEFSDKLEWVIAIYMAARPAEYEIVERYIGGSVSEEQFQGVIGRAVLAWLGYHGAFTAAGSKRR